MRKASYPLPTYARPTITTLKRPEPLTGDIQVPLDANNVQRNAQLQPPNNVVPNERFLWSVVAEWEGRITNNIANSPTGIMPDGPNNVIDTIILRGTDKQLGKKVDVINCHSSILKELYRIQAGISDATFGNVPGVLNPAPGAINDIRVYFPIPLSVLNMPVHQQVDHLFDSTNWDALTMILQTADDQNIFTYGAARGLPTYSAFGSAVGNPRIRLLANFAMGGAKMFEGFKPARVYRYFQQDTSGDVQANGVKVPLQNLQIPRGKRIRSILAKTGTINPNIVAGVNSVFNTLSNAMLTNININRGTNKPINQYVDQFHMAFEILSRYGVKPQPGYNLIDFAPNGNIKESLDLTNAISGPTGDILTQIISDVATLGGTSAIEALWEEIEGPPIYQQVA